MRSPARVMVERRLHMVGNAHLDAVWLWPWEEGYAEVRATFRSALDRMDEDPDFLFACDSVAYYAWVEEHDAAMFRRIRQRVAEGRWELSGGWWVEPDCNLPSGESLVRQGLYGQLYLRSRFGRTARVGMNVDPFGHPATLPQILQGQGLGAYVFFRPLAAEKRLPSSLFRWRSPDGSEVLAYRIPHEYSSGLGVDDLGPHVDAAIASLPGDWTQAMCFYGVGNHGGGPTRANISSVHRLASAGEGIAVGFSTPERFFDAVAAAAPPNALPLLEGDLHHHAVGCYSAHSGVKALNRRAERALGSAEVWSSVAWLVLGRPYPRAELGQAWRQVCFNQFHDILAGTAIESAYTAVRDQVGEALAIAGRTRNAAIQALAARVDIASVEGTSPLLVFNPHGWAVRYPVEVEVGEYPADPVVTDAHGGLVAGQAVRSEATAPNRRRVLFVADVPALGYQLYRVHAAPGPARGTPPPARPGGSVTITPGVRWLTIANDRIRAVIDSTTGWFADVEDLISGSRLSAPLRPEHAEVAEDPGDTWAHGVDRFDDAAGAFEVASVRIVEAGPVRVVVRVESTFGASRLVEDLCLVAGASYLEIRAELDWRERHRVLKLRVPTDLRDPVATFTVPYGTTIRESAGHEEPAQAWVDVHGTLPSGASAGVAVITDAKAAYDVTAGTIGITAARSPAYAWHDPEPLDPASDPVYQDQGVQRFRYAVLPHAGDWRQAGVPYHAEAFCEPPITLLESAHPGVLPSRRSFADVGTHSVMLSTLKAAEDGTSDLIVRIVELDGRATNADLDLGLAGRRLRIPLGPHEIRTYRVPPAPDAPIVLVDLLEDPVADRATRERTP